MNGARLFRYPYVEPTARQVGVILQMASLARRYGFRLPDRVFISTGHQVAPADADRAHTALRTARAGGAAFVGVTLRNAPDTAFSGVCARVGRAAFLIGLNIHTPHLHHTLLHELGHVDLACRSGRFSDADVEYCVEENVRQLLRLAGPELFELFADDWP